MTKPIVEETTKAIISSLDIPKEYIQEEIALHIKLLLYQLYEELKHESDISDHTPNNQSAYVFMIEKVFKNYLHLLTPEEYKKRLETRENVFIWQYRSMGLTDEQIKEMGYILDQETK